MSRNRSHRSDASQDDRVRSAHTSTMTEPERTRVERFEACYNRLDHEFERMTRNDRSNSHRTWSTKVRIASNHFRRLDRVKDFLLEIGELRNAMIHNRTGDDLYLAVPSEATVAELERVEAMVLRPRRVIPTFARDVLTFEPKDSLADVLRTIAANGRSRFPVYDPRDGFIGLLTTNGLTRWAAERLEDTHLHVDTAKVFVDEILEFDHRKDSVIFVARDALVDEVDAIFGQRKSLEAAIITENGRMTEAPLGLICPKDLVQHATPGNNK